MGYVDYEEHFIEEWHKLENEKRIIYCKTHFNRTCDKCDPNEHFCSLNRNLNIKEETKNELRCET
jgi:hypothetical protein